MTDFKTKTPRVEAIIDQVIRRHPGDSKESLARYFEDVHQELAPLARQLEIELSQANEKIAELKIFRKRYIKLVRLTPREFKDFWDENLHTGTAFDVLVDGLR